MDSWISRARSYSERTRETVRATHSDTSPSRSTFGARCVLPWKLMPLHGSEACLKNYDKNDMSHFRVRLSAPESYDGSAGFDDWLRRRLSYLSLADLRYRLIPTTRTWSPRSTESRWWSCTTTNRRLQPRSSGPRLRLRCRSTFVAAPLKRAEADNNHIGRQRKREATNAKGTT